MTFAEPGPPTLIRTSRLSPEYIRKNLDTINVPIRLNTDESFERVEENWSAQELEHERRLVSLKVTRENFTTFNIKFETVAPDCVDKNSKDLVISCIRWAEKDLMVVTSVDILLVLESLVGEPFPVEEKSRIRRNLQFLKPSTVARSTSGRLFNSLMAMENPRPRNIEKDVKVFKWSNFFDALNKVLSKYSANPAVVSLEPRTAPSANPIEPASSGYPSNSNNSSNFAYPAQPGKAYVTMQPPAHYAPLPYEAESGPNPTTHAPITCIPVQGNAFTSLPWHVGKAVAAENAVRQPRPRPGRKFTSFRETAHAVRGILGTLPEPAAVF
ncbi:hypothetical protein OXX59_006639 [Metschnikowia pulcherrima]